jgi:protein-L-isoaspartate(D-aspartate) O-methyltransferase
MNIEVARFNMIEQQVRPWDVLDQRVLDLMMAVPREAFVPVHYRQLAFADIAIPLDHGEVMMNPKVEGRLLQALAIEPRDRILEIGTGSGYLTALLAKSGGQVTSIEIHEDFTHQAEARLKEQGIANVTLEVGDGVRGWERAAPYDVIAVTGSVPVLTDHFERQLALGGRLFVVVGEPPIMEAVLITRVSASEWMREGLFETVLPPLRGALEPPKFVF